MRSSLPVSSTCYLGRSAYGDMLNVGGLPRQGVGGNERNRIEFARVHVRRKVELSIGRDKSTWRTIRKAWGAACHRRQGVCRDTLNAGDIPRHDVSGNERKRVPEAKNPFIRRVPPGRKVLFGRRVLVCRGVLRGRRVLCGRRVGLLGNRRTWRKEIVQKGLETSGRPRVHSRAHVDFGQHKNCDRLFVRG